MAMKWKEPWLEPPELWGEYLCFDYDRRIVVRRYVPVKVTNRKSNGTIRGKVVKKEYADIFAFVASYYCNYESEIVISTRTAYYMELPAPPDPTSDLKKVDLQLEQLTRRKKTLEKFKTKAAEPLKWVTGGSHETE